MNTATLSCPGNTAFFAAPMPEQKKIHATTEPDAREQRPFLAAATRQSVPTRLQEEVQRARQLEREHLARELHDVLGGELTAARLQLACLRSRLAGHSTDVEQRLEQLDTTLAAALALKRRVLHGLEPDSLGHQGLAASLAVFAHEFLDGSRIQATTDLDDVDAGKPTRLAIYRLVQEALTNMVKHAAATEVAIVLRARGRDVTVSVRDNGCGFDPVAGGNHRHGLDGMRHRIQSAGGDLTVESAPGGGTRITATLPRHAVA